MIPSRSAARYATASMHAQKISPRLTPHQVEFYFSDSNLPTDKFMWESTGGEENKPMPLKTICNFKRMRQFQPYSAVVAALRESSFLDVAGEDGEETLTRKKAYVSSTEAQKARLTASVYAKGFGDEEPSTQFDIEAFFSAHGHVKHVKLRRTAEELFKGSVFVEFASAEEADAFVALDPKPTWKGEDLLIMKKKEYLDEKNRQIKEGLLEPNTHRRVTFFEGKERGGSRGGGRGGRGRGDKDRNGKSGDWKDRRGDGDKNSGFKGGRGGRGGRGRGGRGFRGGRGGGRDNRGPRDEKKEDTRKSTNEYVHTPTNSHPSIILHANPRRAACKCPPSSPPTASGRARTPAASPRRRRSTPRRMLFRRNK